MRSMEEGTGHTRSDRFRGCVRIGQNSAGGDPQHPVPVIFQKARAHLVALWPVAHVVDDPVDLDDKPLRHAAEIDDVVADLMLAPELEAVRALA
jgi:hypothetical protein